MIHRDLKPENILLQSGQPVIADFGIALAVSKAGGARVTQTGLSLGTPQYMSPEQAAGDRAIDGRSDIYSLGAVTYEMLAGEPPHSGTSAQAIIAKLMTAEPQPLRALRKTVPVHVEAAVAEALAKLPADRFASAREFADSLSNRAFRVTPKSAGAAVDAAVPARTWNGVAITATALAAVCLAAALWGWLRPAPAKPVVRYAFVLDSNETLRGDYGRIALSPDGSRLVYTGGPRGQLLVRQRNQLHATPLPGTEGAQSPFFSPDGERVGFYTGISLKAASLGGGPLISLTDSTSRFGGASWGPDGFVYASAPNGTGLVRLAAKAGAVPSPFTLTDTTNGESAQRWPDVLPNGKGVLFTVWYGGKNKSGSAIAVANIQTGKYAVLVNGVRARYSATGHLLYVTADGTLMAAPFDQDTRKITGAATVLSEGMHLALAGAVDVAVSMTGTLVYATGGPQSTRELVWVTREGRAEPVDSSWQAEFDAPRLSPNGAQLAVAVGNATAADVWIKQLDRGPSLKLTLEGGVNRYPTWTPDGRSVTYYSNAAHVQELWTKRADGSAPAVLQLHQERDLAEGLWSPDGTWLIFRTSQSVFGAGDIMGVRPGTDTVPVPLVATRFSELSPTISPDGRWMAYESNETGRFEVYVVPFPNAGSAKWLVSTRGGTEPLWSRRGDELFYRDGTGNIVAAEVKTAPAFSVGRTTVLFAASEFVTGPLHRGYDVSADGRRFLMVRPVGGNAQERLVVVENWGEEVKGRGKK